MTTKWALARISDLLTIQNGFAFDSKNFSDSKGVPLIRIRDLKVGRGTETRYSGSFDKRYEVKAGDFLIGMDGEFGCYEWKGDKALTKQREFFHIIPPLYEQRRIAEKLDSLLDEVKRLDTIYIRRLAYLSELKQALLEKAFSGELTSPRSRILKEAAE